MILKGKKVFGIIMLFPKKNFTALLQFYRFSTLSFSTYVFLLLFKGNNQHNPIIIKPFSVQQNNNKKKKHNNHTNNEKKIFVVDFENCIRTGKNLYF